MQHQPPDNTADPDLQLPRDIYHQLVHSLFAMLPADPSGTQEDRSRQARVALAQVAALLPANADEADLAAHYVAASAHAADCLRQAARNATHFDCATKCRAQASAMMRQARGYRSLLLRVQAARQKREANDTTRERDAWTGQAVLGLMAEALQPPPAPEAVAVAAEVAPAPAPRAAPKAVPAELAAEGDAYALHYPRRARLIRRHGGLPPDCDFGPPDPELVHAIVAGTSPVLRAADRDAAA